MAGALRRWSATMCPEQVLLLALPVRAARVDRTSASMQHSQDHNYLPGHSVSL
jgi:hypothetical protein